MRRYDRGSVKTILVGLLAIGWLIGSGGCNDHRITLQQFLESQQQAQEEQPSSQPTEAQKAVEQAINESLGPFKVGPEDVLAVTLTVAGETQLFPTLQVRVDRQGSVDLPLVGQVQVASSELEDVEDAIQAAYVPDVYQQAVVHVSLLTAHTTNVLVTGTVLSPGLVELPGNQRNLLYAIVHAGGVSNIASGAVTLQRIRKPDEKVTLNLTDPLQLSQALALDPLQDGDILVVHAATPNMIFIGGLVNAPRPQIYPPGAQITVLQAIAASGGLRTDVTPKEATLIRRMPDGQDVHVKLDLDRLTTGKDQNITLAAGDIFWVPWTTETRVQDWINKNIYVGAVGSGGVRYDVKAIDFLNGGEFGGGDLEDSFDPFGFLTRGGQLQNLSNRPVP